MSGTKGKKLTPRQAQFVKEYLLDLNATQAAIRAGYSAKTADRIGPELLGKTCVADAIGVAMEHRSTRTDITQDRVLYELAAMAFYDPADIAKVSITKPADIASLPEQVRRAIIGWSWDKHGNFVLKLATKTPNVELIGRHLAMFRERVEVTGKDGGPIQHEQAEYTREQLIEMARERGLPTSIFGV